MKMEQDSLNKIQSIATILSLIAIPIVIATVGWYVQASISTEGIKKDYVQIAIGILKDNEKQKDDELRKWAVSVLDKNSPVPFSKNLRIKLEAGEIFVKIPFPEPPKELMTPPIKLQPLLEKQNTTTKEILLNAAENFERCHENAITQEYLQEWVMTVKSIDEEYQTKSKLP